MLNLNLRQAIMQRIQNKDENQLEEIINGSIDGDEKALPGLGVLFEMIWKNIDQNEQQKLLQSLHNQVLASSK